MKHFFLLLLAVTLFANLAHAQDAIYVMVTDSDPITNVRSAPNGKVVMTLLDTCSYILDITEPRNGWWKITEIECAEEATNIALEGSPTQQYWIHNSVIGSTTRNYGNQKWCLRSKPSIKGKPTYWFIDSIIVHPINVSGDWVKVKCNGHIGWIEYEMLCFNPLTTCP